MNFPILHIPGLGDGMTIALDAVLHVLISHSLAIGVVTLAVLFQGLGAYGHGAYWTRFGRKLLGAAVVITTSVGAMTGVGIWFITGALAPGGIGSLIHLFFWPWFIEWIAFTCEVIFLLVYYYSWDRLVDTRPRLLLGLGYGYVFMAVMSAVLISGILGFMLTPDGWPTGQRFVQAYFNPTFYPQIVLRVFAGLSIGSLICLTWAGFSFDGEPAERGQVLRACGLAFFICAAIAGAAGLIYFGRIPNTYLTHWVFAVATSAWAERPELLYGLNWLAAVVIVLAALAGLAKRPGLARVLGIPALILCVGLVTEFERVREFVRGPYLLPGYMYANQVPLVHNLAASESGLLPDVRWLRDEGGRTPDEIAGRALFDANCGVCHTIGGVNDILVRIQGRTLEGVNAITGITESMVPFMTPFSGTEQERMTMSTYLYVLANAQARPAPQLRKEMKK